MLRKHDEEEHENHERWLVSYADFITLLFAFFVVMYSISSVNEGKYRILSSSLTDAFRNVTTNTQGVALIVRSDPSAQPVQMQVIAPPKSKPNPEEEARKRKARERMRNMADEIKRVLNPLVQGGQVRVTEGPNGISIEINASVLFAQGDASLGAEAVKALQAIGEVVAKGDFPITVEGHTDNVPISNAFFPSNWELSAVRASSVVRLFVATGVAPERLTASGYGDQRPVTSNDTPEGRARNRRVTIFVQSNVVDKGGTIDEASIGTSVPPQPVRMNNVEGALGTPSGVQLVPEDTAAQ